jgi:hypothetical protein
VPRVGVADLTLERLVARAGEDLANGIGNLVDQVVTTARGFQDGRVGPDRADRTVQDRSRLFGRPVRFDLPGPAVVKAVRSGTGTATPVSPLPGSP